MPRAFLVHADRDGNSVTMMITPNSVMDRQGDTGSERNGMGNNDNGSMTGNSYNGRFGSDGNNGGTASQ